jgi:hypothetical protein
MRQYPGLARGTTLQFIKPRSSPTVKCSFPAVSGSSRFATDLTGVWLLLFFSVGYIYTP